MTMLMDEDQAKAFVRERLDSRQWWTFMSFGTGAATIQAIEAEFYDGEANADFEVVMIPLPDVGLMALHFAHKRRLPVAALSQYLADGAKSVVDALSERDVLALGDSEDDQEAYQAGMWALNAWVYEAEWVHFRGGLLDGQAGQISPESSRRGFALYEWIEDGEEWVCGYWVTSQTLDGCRVFSYGAEETS